MAEAATLRPAVGPASEPSDIFADAGLPKYNRRLTDKILAAFNHAYSLGETDLADMLWNSLVAAEKISQREQSRRRPNQAIDLAAKWIAFVDARNRYRALSDGDNSATTSEAGQVFQTMKAAYIAWISQLRQN
jgi:hypothetical protein